MNTPALGQTVTYMNAANEPRTAKVVGLELIEGSGMAGDPDLFVAEVKTSLGYTARIVTTYLTWEIASPMSRADIDTLLDLVQVAITDTRDGALSGTSWSVEDMEELEAKLKGMRKTAA